MAYFYTKDRLGSVRELVDSSQTTRARFEYTPYGKRQQVEGDLQSTVGYTGHHHHAPSNLVLTWYRQYDPNQGRWINRDPIGESDGPNIYAYVKNASLSYVDLKGLDRVEYSILGHKVFYVQEYDACGKPTGLWTLYEFAPDTAFKSNYGKSTGIVAATLLLRNPLPLVIPLRGKIFIAKGISSPPAAGSLVKTSYADDKHLHDLIEVESKNPQVYHAVYNNCRHFADRYESVSKSSPPPSPLWNIINPAGIFTF